jgi:hypothetical protein
MAIELTEYNWAAKVVKSGIGEDITIAAGQSLKIETSPDGEEVLDIACPVGKAWNARIIVEIDETDAE